MSGAGVGNGRKVLAVSLVTLSSAGLYGLVRVSAPSPWAPSFLGACARLKASGLPVTASDWFCNPSTVRPHVIFVGVSLLVWLGLVLPCAILAATGRRFTALLPILIAPWVVSTASGFLFNTGETDWFGTRDWWGTRYWDSHHVVALLLNFVLIAAPVVAVGLAWGSSRRERSPQPRWWGGLLAAVPPTLVSWGVLMLARGSYARHFDFGGAPTMSPWAPFLISALQIAVFSALLGTDRPWSLAPVAFFLSSALVGVVAGMGFEERWVVWSEFGMVVPLAAIGLVWSGWRPLALRLSGRREVVAEVAQTPSARRVRPVVVLNAAAVALLAVSAIAYRADPLPIRIGEPIPTYLGYRDRVDDVRARTNLDMAISAAGLYREERGTWKGFDAKTAAAIQDQLTWVDPAPATDNGSPTLHFQTATIATASRPVVRIVTRSQSGDFFCIQRTPDAGVTWGSGRSQSAAAADCGSNPWTAHETQPMPQLDCPSGAEQGYLICRMVQVLAIDIMKTPKPL